MNLRSKRSREGKETEFACRMRGKKSEGNGDESKNEKASASLIQKNHLYPVICESRKKKRSCVHRGSSYESSSRALPSSNIRSLFTFTTFAQGGRIEELHDSHDPSHLTTKGTRSNRFLSLSTPSHNFRFSPSNYQASPTTHSFQFIRSLPSPSFRTLFLLPLLLLLPLPLPLPPR